MDTAERTIILCLSKWRSIFPSYASVLNHMFCVIGNGYEWVNGELVTDPIESENYILTCKRDSTFMKRLILDIEKKNLEDEQRDKAWLDGLPSLVRNELKKVSFDNYRSVYEPEDIEKRLGIVDISANDVYPLSERFSHMFTIPENATMPFKKLCLQAINMVIQAKPEGNRFPWNEIMTSNEYAEQNKMLAKQALYRFNGIFGVWP